MTDKKDTEAGTTETESDSEKGTEADDKKKDEDKKKGQAGETDPALDADTFLYRAHKGWHCTSGLCGSGHRRRSPARVTTHPVDYADGVFQVTVPKGTDALQLSVQKTGKDCGTDLTDLLFFARWGGYFTESESKWQLCPYLLDGDTALYSAAHVIRCGRIPAAAAGWHLHAPT